MNSTKQSKKRRTGRVNFQLQEKNEHAGKKALGCSVKSARVAETFTGIAGGRETTERNTKPHDFHLISTVLSGTCLLNSPLKALKTNILMT